MILERRGLHAYLEVWCLRAIRKTFVSAAVYVSSRGIFPRQTVLFSAGSKGWILGPNQLRVFLC